MRARGWAALLIAVAVVVAAVPQVTGRMAESRMRELVATFNQSSAWKATIDSYERTWTRSESVVRFQAGDGGDVAEVRTTSRHGPMGGLNLASGTSELRWLGTPGAAMRRYFGDDAPATATHTVALDQSLRVAFATPALDRALADAPATRVAGTGSTGTLTIERSGRYAFDHRYRKFTVRDGASTLEIDDVALASAGRVGDAALQSPAQFSLSANAIRFGDGTASMAIADASVSGRMIPGSESLDVKFGHVVGAGHVDGRGGALRWKKIEIQVTLADVSRAAIEGFSRDVRGASDLAPSDPRRMQLGLAAIGSATEALLKRDPTLSLDAFTYEGAEGTLSITATARVDRALRENGAPLPLAIAILARVSIARALAQAWLAAALRPNVAAAMTQHGGSEPVAADVDRRSHAMAGEVLVSAAQAGLFREGADPIVVEIVAKEGRVLANGLSPERLAELGAALLPGLGAR